MLLGFALALLGTQVVFQYYADAIFGRILKEVVERRSDYLYTVSYQDMGFSFIGSELTFEGLSLSPNRKLFYDSLQDRWNTRNEVFEAEIPRLSVKGLNPYRIYAKKALILKGIEVEKPTVRAFLNKLPKADSSEVEPGNRAFSLLSDRVQFFLAQSINLSKATFEAYAPKNKGIKKWVVSDISANAINLLIDSATLMRDQRPFTVEDLHVKAGENKLSLPNSPYTVGFKDFEVSTYGGLLDIQGLKISCSERGKKEVAEGGMYSVFECDIPSLSGRGVDFRSAYFQKSIQMQKFSLTRPEIRVFRQKSTRGRPPRSIYPKLSKVIKELVLREVSLDDASVTTHWLPASKYAMPNKIQHISGKLKQFQVDGATHTSRVKFFYVDHADLTIGGYRQMLPDRHHALSAGKIKVSTEEDYLEVAGLRLSRLQSPQERMASDSSQAFGSLSLELPLAKAKDLDIKRAYIDKEFDLGYLLLYQPNIDLFHYSADSLLPSQNDSLVRIKDLYPYFKSFTQYVNIGLLDLRESQFRFSQHWFDQKYNLDMDSLSLELRGWQVGRRFRPPADKLFNAQSIDASWKRFHIMRPDSLYTIDIGQGRISQKDSLLELENLALIPHLSQFDSLPEHERPPKALQFSINYLRLDSIDLAQAYYRGDANIHTLLIDRPQMKWRQLATSYEPQLSDLSLEERLQAVLSRNFKALRIKNIILNRGSWETKRQDSLQGFRIRQLVVGVRGLRIDSTTLADPAVLFRLDTLQLSTDALYWPLPDQIHGLHINQIGVRTGKKKLFLKGVVIDTLPGSIIPPETSIYHARIPRMELSGLDLDKFYYQDRVHFDTLAIPKSKLTVDWQTKASSQGGIPDLDSLYWLAVSPLKSLKLGHFTLDTMALEVIDQKKEKRWHKGRWTLQVDDAYIDAETPMKANRFLYAESWRVSVEDLLQEIGDSTHRLKAQRLALDLGNRRFEGKGILWKPLEYYVEQVDAHIQIPEIAVEGMEVEKWYRTGRVHLEELNLQSPTVALDLPFTPEDQRRRFDWTTLAQALPPSVPEVKLGALVLNKGNFLVQRYAEVDSSLLYRFPYVSTRIAGLQVDTTQKALERFLFSDTVELTLAQQHFNLPDSLHFMRFDTLKLNIAERRLSLVNPQFRPIDTIGVYSKKLGYETDWIDMKSERVELSGWEVQRFVETGSFLARHLHFDRLNADVYRDKRMKDRENYYPPLPRSALRRLLFDLTLDTVSVEDGYIRYREQPLNSNVPGIVRISNLDAVVRNITNDPFLEQYWESIEIDASMKLMEEGRITAVFDLPYRSDNGEYYYEGKLDSMDFTSLNDILTPVANIKIRSGYANSANFKVAGDNDYATGIMKLKYEDLRVSVINPEKQDNDGLLSFLANTFVVNRSNPHHLIFMKKGKIFFRRNRQKSLFNYWAKSLLSGVKTSIGIKNQEKIPRAVKGAFLDKVLEQFKAEGRQKRREKRQKRREMREQLRKARKEEG